MADPDQSRKILDFAKGKLGQRIGKGIGKGTCWDLPDKALTQAGAQSSTTTGDNDNYVWGVEIPLLQAAPGDILQFRDHVIRTKVVTRTTFDDGSFTEKWSENVQRRPHHSAIVAANDGQRFELYEQSVKPKGKVVQYHTLPYSGGTTVKKETREVKDAKGKVRPATVVETTTVVVSGFLWAYKPQGKP